MRFALLVTLLTACGPAATSTVRGANGEPLPTHAVIDDDNPSTKVHCSDGMTYTIVESRTRALASWRMTQPAPVTDPVATCDKIRRY